MNESTKNRLLFWLTVLFWLIAVVSAGFLGYYNKTYLYMGHSFAGNRWAFCLSRVTAMLAFGLAAGITLVKVVSVLCQSVIAKNWKTAWLCTIGLLAAWLIDYCVQEAPLHPTYYHHSMLPWEFLTYREVNGGFYPMKIVFALILLWKLARASFQKV